jgi:oxalate decarboxylase/phosphoglucose isomerase-like protein (cupin superfamily)
VTAEEPRGDRSRGVPAIEYTIAETGPRLGPTAAAETQGTRLVGGLAKVAAVDVLESDARVQYWTFGDVAGNHDRAHIADLPVMYDLTFLDSRPIGWEAAKTHGHVHTSGHAEVYEVLEGVAGVFVQDLLPGPSATFAALIQAGPGETVVLPPRLHHASINLGDSMLVLADANARASNEMYEDLRDAGGMGYFIDIEGHAVANPAYDRVPPLRRLDARDWLESDLGPLYADLVSRPASFDWLCGEEGFWERFPQAATILGEG